MKRTMNVLLINLHILLISFMPLQYIEKFNGLYVERDEPCHKR